MTNIDNIEFISMPRGHYGYRIRDNETGQLLYAEDFIQGREKTLRAVIKQLLEHIEDGG